MEKKAEIIKPSILFHRNYLRFRGGHLKVFDYFNHAKFSDQYHPEIYLTPQSCLIHPWVGEPRIKDHYNPKSASILFLAGMDWTALSAYPDIENSIPVVNLIQGFRHSTPSTALFRLLRRRAIRICVSDELAMALEATGICNGPIYVIQNGIDLGLLPNSRCLGSETIFIGGVKQPSLASALAERLRAQGYAVNCQTSHIPRSEFLEQLSRSKIAVLLPLETEGFFLPALEAMAMGIAVICPDCVGNRSFCVDKQTALMPLLDLECLEAAVKLLFLNPGLAAALCSKGKEMSLRHDIRTERNMFLNILHQIRPQ